MSPDSTNGAWTQPDPPSSLRNEVCSGVKHCITPLPTAVLGLVPAGSAFMVSGDVNFAQGQSCLHKGDVEQSTATPTYPGNLMLNQQITGFIPKRSR